MTRKEQDKLWNGLSEEKKKEYRKEFQQESESYHQNVKHCDRENEFEYHTGYSNGVISTLEELFGEHNLKPSLTYGDVVKELFKNGAWQVAGREYPREFVFNEGANDHYFLNCASEEQGQKLLAINKLLNVAKFLNKNEVGGDWVPDWKKVTEKKWYPYLRDEEIIISFTTREHFTPAVFLTEEIAQQAVQILGEDVIRTALTTEY